MIPRLGVVDFVRSLGRILGGKPRVPSSLAGNSLTCNLGTLALNESATINITNS